MYILLYRKWKGKFYQTRIRSTDKYAKLDFNAENHLFRCFMRALIFPIMKLFNEIYLYSVMKIHLSLCLPYFLLVYLLTYCPSCHRQLGQQQILSISGGLEPVSVRFPMIVPWLSPQPQQYVSMSSLDARVFCVPLVSIRLVLLGWSLDLCVIYGLSISSVYVQLWFLYFLTCLFFLFSCNFCYPHKICDNSVYFNTYRAITC